MSDIESMAGFLKNFHIPSKWKCNENINFLINHRYIMESVSKESIKNSLELSGYFNNTKMLHDYIYYMIQDILDKNGESYITKHTIKYNRKIQTLLMDNIPDFIIKSNYPRKTFILDICFDNRYDYFNTLLEKYKKLSYFSDFCIINCVNDRLNFSGCRFLSNEDGMYLVQNFELFEMAYKYWQACATNGVIHWSDTSSIKIKEYKKISNDSNNLIFEQALTQYALAVADREKI